MSKRTLQRRGYKVKHSTSAGWWVDGACGYMVSSYWPTEEEAIQAASERIAEAIAEKARPTWLIR